MLIQIRPSTLPSDQTSDVCSLFYLRPHVAKNRFGYHSLGNTLSFSLADFEIFDESLATLVKKVRVGLRFATLRFETSGCDLAANNRWPGEQQGNIEVEIEVSSNIEATSSGFNASYNKTKIATSPEAENSTSFKKGREEKESLSEKVSVKKYLVSIGGSSRNATWSFSPATSHRAIAEDTTLNLYFDNQFFSHIEDFIMNNPGQGDLSQPSIYPSIEFMRSDLCLIEFDGPLSWIVRREKKNLSKSIWSAIWQAAIRKSVAKRIELSLRCEPQARSA